MSCCSYFLAERRLHEQAKPNVITGWSVLIVKSGKAQRALPCPCLGRLFRPRWNTTLIVYCHIHGFMLSVFSGTIMYKGVGAAPYLCHATPHVRKGKLQSYQNDVKTIIVSDLWSIWCCLNGSLPLARFVSLYTVFARVLFVFSQGIFSLLSRSLLSSWGFRKNSNITDFFSTYYTVFLLHLCLQDLFVCTFFTLFPHLWIPTRVWRFH